MLAKKGQITVLYLKNCVERERERGGGETEREREIVGREGQRYRDGTEGEEALRG